MNLSDFVKQQVGESPRNATGMYEEFGVVGNPFPPAGAPGAHPHFPTAAEVKINNAVVSFHRDEVSQVLIVEGTQGVGKTNLLSYIQEQLRELYSNDKAFYIIRYYPDPEASFDGIIRRIFQEFGEAQLLARIGTALSEKSEMQLEALVEAASSYDMRLMLRALAGAASNGDEGHFEVVCHQALEWLVGLRLLKSHKEYLGVQFRLDTVEAKTQALRDLVFCCAHLGLLRGMFLLLDELEKQDYSISKLMVLRYLSAIRALIDALPKHLFMLVALTTEARRRYFLMLPAFAGRLQNSVVLKPIQSEEQALGFADFYIEHAREEAKSLVGSNARAGANAVIEPAEIAKTYRQLLQQSADEKGLEGVSQRDFLNTLHSLAEKRLTSV